MRLAGRGRRIFGFVHRDLLGFLFLRSSRPPNVDDGIRRPNTGMNQRQVNQGVRDRVINGHPQRSGVHAISEAPHRQHEHGKADALAQGLVLAGLGCGDDLAAGVDDEETHDGDADLTDENSAVTTQPSTALPNSLKMAATISVPQVSSLSAIGSMKLAQFGDLVIFAGHPNRRAYRCRRR